VESLQLRMSRFEIPRLERNHMARRSNSAPKWSILLIPDNFEAISGRGAKFRDKFDGRRSFVFETFPDNSALVWSWPRSSGGSLSRMSCFEIPTLENNYMTRALRWKRFCESNKLNDKRAQSTPESSNFPLILWERLLSRSSANNGWILLFEKCSAKLMIFATKSEPLSESGVHGQDTPSSYSPLNLTIPLSQIASIGASLPTVWALIPAVSPDLWDLPVPTLHR